MVRKMSSKYGAGQWRHCGVWTLTKFAVRYMLTRETRPSRNVSLWKRYVTVDSSVSLLGRSRESPSEPFGHYVDDAPKKRCAEAWDAGVSRESLCGVLTVRRPEVE